MRAKEDWRASFMELLRVRRAAEGEKAMRPVDEWQVCSLDKGDSMNEVHVFDDILEAQGFLVGLPAPVCHEGGIWEGRHIMRHVVRHYRGEVTVAEQKRATVAEQERAEGAEQERAEGAEQERDDALAQVTKLTLERDEARRALVKAEDRARSFKDGWEKHKASVSAMCQRLGADFERQPCDVSTLGAAVESMRRASIELTAERDDARRDASSGLLPGLLESKT